MSRRKKSDKKNSSDDETESFHGFTDSEIETASLKSDRSSIFSISSSGKKQKSEANSDPNNPSLLVLGKRQWKPSQKIKENNQSPNSKVLSLGSPNVKKTENSKLALKSDVKVSKTEDLPTSSKVRN